MVSASVLLPRQQGAADRRQLRLSDARLFRNSTAMAVQAEGTGGASEDGQPAAHEAAKKLIDFKGRARWIFRYRSPQPMWWWERACTGCRRRGIWR